MFESCIISDHDLSKVYSRRKLVCGRKGYQCCECYRAIPQGEQHWYETGTYQDGGWWTNRTCFTCNCIRESLMRGSWIYGELWECVIEYYCQTKDDWQAMVPDTYLKAAGCEVDDD